MATDIVNPIVRLKKPLKFDEWYQANTPDKFIAGATVTLSDGATTVDLKEYALKGYYTAKTEFNGVVGKTYTLTIKYKGKTYTASDKLVAVKDKFDAFPFKVDSVQYLNDYNFNIDPHNFGFNTPSIAVFEYVTPAIIGERDHPEDWTNLKNPLAPFSFDKLKFDQIVFDNNIDLIYAHSSPRLDASFPFNSNVPVFTYQKDRAVSVYQFSVSANYYIYLTSLFADTEWVGLFSTLPGDLPTNLSEGALGYFWATDIQKSSFPILDVVQ